MGTRVTARFVDPLRNTDSGDAVVRTAVDMLAEAGPCLRWLKGAGVDDGGSCGGILQETLMSPFGDIIWS